MVETECWNIATALSIDFACLVSIFATTVLLWQLLLWYQAFVALVFNRAMQDVVGGLANDDAIVGSQRNEGVWSLLDVFDQVGVKDEFLAVKSCEFDHDSILMGYLSIAYDRRLTTQC